MSVTARGGYQIVDFKNVTVPFGSKSDPIPGIYEQAKNCMNKPVVLFNLDLAGTPMNALYVGGSSVDEENETVVFTFISFDTIIVISITSDDKAQTDNAN